MKSSLLFVLSLGLLAAGCAAEPPAQPEPKASAAAASTAAPTQSQEPAKISLSGKVFGDKITETTETPLGHIADDPVKYADKTVRTSGVVQAVCQTAGCWMEIEDPEAKRVHIKMAGHAFLVPKSASGHRAIVQGTVKGGAPQPACGGNDSCGGTDKGALAKVEIVATGVEFID